eukprot:jgi/Galph1/1062/GphlegSOOS_G5771.1
MGSTPEGKSFFKEVLENLGTPEEPPPLPKEIQKFFKSLGYGMTAGMVTGAVFGWKETKDPKIPSPPDLPRNPHARATFFVTRGIMAYGVRFSVFTGIFVLTDIFCSKLREGKEDFINTTVAGSVTSSLSAIGGFGRDLLTAYVERAKEEQRRALPGTQRSRLEETIKSLEQESEKSLKGLKVFSTSHDEKFMEHEK